MSKSSKWHPRLDVVLVKCNKHTMSLLTADLHVSICVSFVMTDDCDCDCDTRGMRKLLLSAAWLCLGLWSTGLDSLRLGLDFILYLGHGGLTSYIRHGRSTLSCWVMLADSDERVTCLHTVHADRARPLKRCTVNDLQRPGRQQNSRANNPARSNNARRPPFQRRRRRRCAPNKYPAAIGRIYGVTWWLGLRRRRNAEVRRLLAVWMHHALCYANKRKDGPDVWRLVYAWRVNICIYDRGR